jgi:hypothetical protein
MVLFLLRYGHPAPAATAATSLTSQLNNTTNDRANKKTYYKCTPPQGIFPLLLSQVYGHGNNIPRHHGGKALKFGVA